jgi:uncharacterized protein involved in exopolysaccharide biosynthesis
LSNQLEQARLAEVRDTPALTVVQAPTVPARRSAPRRRALVLGLAALGFTLGAASAIWRQVGARGGTTVGIRTAL